MRTLPLLVAALSLLPLAALPNAHAGHVGACWHEYAEGAVWAIHQPSPVKAYGMVIANCNERAVDQVCYVVTGNRECVSS